MVPPPGQNQDEDWCAEEPMQPMQGSQRKPHSFQHRWARHRVKLPSDNLDSSFHSEVVEYAKQRIAQRCLTPWEEAEPRGQSQEHCKNSWEKEAIPKYLATACISSNGIGCITSRAPSRCSTSRAPSRSARGWLAPVKTGLRTSRQPRGSCASQRSASEADWSIRVAESPTSLVVSTKELGVTRIPPRTWLVLDGPLAASDDEASCCHPRSDEGETSGGAGDRGPDEEYSNGIPEVALCGAAGGGHVISNAGSQLLHLVPKERLHPAAAEANFRKASCGSSMVALKHAALIAGLLKEQEAWLHESHVGRSSMDTRHLLTLPQSDEQPLGSQLLGSVSRARRLEGCVVNQALAAQKRTESPTALIKPNLSSKVQGEHENRPSSSRKSFGGRHDSRKIVLREGYKVLTNFLQFAKRKYGNVVRTWFHLDPDGSMRIGQMQFIRQVQDMGFRESPYTMWKYLDSRGAGSITILELDPASAKLLAGFKLLLDCTFGANIPFDFFDCNRSGKINKEEFVRAVQQLGYIGPASHLFHLLDRSGHGFVGVRDLGCLDRWHPPLYMFCLPDAEGFKALKDVLIFTYGSLLRGWRKVLDRDSNMRISWEEWTGAFLKLRKSLPEELRKKMPKNLEELSSAWRALDEYCAGWVALREFDEASFQILQEFRSWALKRHGSALKAFHKMDNANGKLTLGELKRGMKHDLDYQGDIEVLFDALDVNRVGTLAENEVRFLDFWDLDWEDWEVSAKRSLDFGLDKGTAHSMCQKTVDERQKKREAKFRSPSPSLSATDAVSPLAPIGKRKGSRTSRASQNSQPEEESSVPALDFIQISSLRDRFNSLQSTTSQ